MTRRLARSQMKRESQGLRMDRVRVQEVERRNSLVEIELEVVAVEGVHCRTWMIFAAVVAVGEA